MLCSFQYAFFFVGENISADHFKYYILPSLEAKDRLQLALNVEFNHVRDKVKPQCKLPNEVYKEQYGHYPFLSISPFPTLIEFTGFLGVIQYCVTVVGKWIFDSNIPFKISLTHDEL